MDDWTRYAAKFEECGPDDCWPWTAGTTGRTGHGLFRLDGYGQSAANAGFQLRYGRKPKGGLVRHTCDNGGCQNPGHWLEGTVADNSLDMILRGRSTATVTNSEVKEVREEYSRGVLTQKMLAEVYGVTQTTISKIITGRTRVHV